MRVDWTGLLHVYTAVNNLSNTSRDAVARITALLAREERHSHAAKTLCRLRWLTSYKR